MSVSKTAGIIIIGNEILSGKVRDSNSYYLACELRSLGVDVKGIAVIPDDTEVIGKKVVSFSRQFDHVFTSGGVGPTHDDVTMAGIASGFEVGLVRSDTIVKLLSSRYADIASSSVMKMAEVPEGCEIEYQENMRFPVVTFRNIYIFPGIPEYMQNKFSMLREKFRTSEFFLKRLYLNCHESTIADILTAVDGKYSNVAIGSYPVLGQTDYRVIVTAETKSEGSLDNAIAELVQSLPESVLVRVE